MHIYHSRKFKKFSGYGAYQQYRDPIDERSAKANIYNLNYQNLIDEKSAKILNAALADTNFKDLPQDTRDAVRAKQFKRMLLACIG